MSRTRQFPEQFLWGTATASYQVEGAVAEGGRGESIWDRFSHTPGKVVHGQTGDVAVDQYHRYPEDVALMREINLGAYRFSIAWPRIQPTGSGKPNQEGLDYYKRLIDELHAAGISAAATLYHWDLPQALQDAGGWPQRDTAERFAEYAGICFEQLGDHVDMWTTLNEPWCSSILGYLEGVHAPGIRDRSQAYAAAHHLMLGHGLAVQRYRSSGGSKPIGVTLNMDSPRPATTREDDVIAADRAADLRTRFFLNPLMGKSYPERHLAAYPEATPPPVKSGDEEIMAAPIDFLGLNFYHEPTIGTDPTEMHPERYREVPTYHATTEMGWPITPRGLYRHIHWVWKETEGRWPLYITENGCACRDELSADGTRCHDTGRIQYLRDHLSAALDAIEDGVDLRGYFLWSLIDNFEWSFGYTKRFGIIYADYVNNRRVPKDSFYFYRDVIAGTEAL